MSLKNFDWSRIWDDKIFFKSRYVDLYRSRFDDFSLGIQITNVGIWLSLGWFNLDIGFYALEDI